MFDSQKVSQAIVEVAEAEILPRFRCLKADEIKTKTHPGDLVTVADTEAEKALSLRLTQIIPDSKVVGEEGVAADSSVLNLLEGDAPVWIIDPVDGTANFAQGNELFGVMVALVIKGETQAGWIYDPLQQKMVWALKGQGAFCGNSRLQASKPLELMALRGYFGCRRTPALEKAVAANINHGSAAHDYIALAEGRMDFAFYRRVKPWDHAAGALIYQEAGGIARMTRGENYRPLANQEGLLVAANSSFWQELQRLIMANYQVCN